MSKHYPGDRAMRAKRKDEDGNPLPDPERWDQKYDRRRFSNKQGGKGFTRPLRPRQSKRRKKCRLRETRKLLQAALDLINDTGRGR